MAGLEINVVTDGSEIEETSENPTITAATIVVTSYANIAPTDYSNTIVAQNVNNASVVSVFPLVGDVPQEAQVTETATVVQTTSTPTATGGSVY